MEVLITKTALMFYLIGLVSMLMHAVKKWVAGEIVGSIIDWYVMHPKFTVGAALAMLGGLVTAILTGTLTDYNNGAQIVAAWGIGYAADTINNQGMKNV